MTLLGIYLLGKLTVRCIIFLMQHSPSLLPAAIPDAAGICPLSTLSLQPLLFPVSAAVHAKQAWMKIDLILLSGPPSLQGAPDFNTRDSPVEIPAFLRSFHSLFRMLFYEMSISDRGSFIVRVGKTAAALKQAALALFGMNADFYFGHLKLSEA